MGNLCVFMLNMNYGCCINVFYLRYVICYLYVILYGVWCDLVKNI